MRALFLFACYTGTAYADAVSVTRKNLHTDDEGDLWLKYRRKKNRLQEFKKSVELAYDDSLKKQNVVSAELLKNALARKAVILTKLLQMGERERERLLARSKEINSTSTYRHSGYYQKYLKD